MDPDDPNHTHILRKFSGGQLDCLADKLFTSGLECRRDDLLCASALLRKLACDGDAEVYVWRLDGEAE